MKHKLGIIGYGTMGSWHAQNVSERINNLDVALIYDIDPKKRALARENGFNVCDNEEEFFNSPIDMVLVATPNNFHKIHCIQAMKNGKNVVSEKPACLSMQELEEVIAVSNETGMLYTVHQNRRFDTDYAIIKNIVKQNLLGKNFYLNSRLYGNRGFSNASWKSLYETGGGLLYDWGIHLIDQVLCLFEDDAPIYVYAELQKVRMVDVDDVCRVTIEFKSGLKVQVIADLWCYIGEARWHLEGSEGTAIIDKWFGQDGKIIRAKNQIIKWEEGCVYTPNGLSTTMWPRAEQDLEELPLPIPETLPRWEEFYENIIEVIEGKAKPIVTHEQIKKSLAIIMASFESSKNHSVVNVDKYLRG